jgi:outer membrane cobalamin receptor
MKRLIVLEILFLLKSLPVLASQLEIRVVDSQGAVIVGAAVDVYGKGQAFTGQTDSKGELDASVSLPVRIRVTATGFSVFELKLEALPPKRLEVRMSPAVLHTAIEVFVRDENETTQTRERTALEIEREGARTVYDAVDKLVPGAYVTRRGSMGYGLNSPSGAISIRGIGGIPNTQVLMVVDGRPDFMGLMGHPIPDFYTLSDVGSLSVTQGPASVRYGSGAMGGAIEVISAPIPEGFHTEFTTGFGSFDGGQHRLSHEARIKQGYYRLTAGITHTSGDRPNSAFHGQDGSLSLGYDLSAAWKASFQGRYGHFNVEDPGTIDMPVAGHYAKVGRGGFNLSLKNTGSRSWGSTGYFSSYGHHMLWDGFRSTDETRGVRHEQSFVMTPQFSLETGASIARYGGRARNIKSSLEYGKHYVSEEGIFTQARYILTTAFVFNAGIRYNHNSLYGGIAVPEFGASYRLNNRYSISAAVGKGFRNPTIRELYLFPAPNPSLRPEQLWNYQLTFQMSPLPSLHAWTTFFYADIQNLIVAIGLWPNTKYENAGQALNKGFELNGRWQPLRRLTLKMGYAYLHSTNLAPYVPGHKLNYSLDLNVGRIFLSFSGVSVGKTWADAVRTQQLESYSVLTLKGTVFLHKNISMFAVLDNLLNRHYQVVAGYPMPGLNASGGFRFKF